MIIVRNLLLIPIVSVFIYVAFILFEAGIVQADQAIGDPLTVVTQTISAGFQLDCDATTTFSPSIGRNLTGLAPASGPALADFECTVTTNSSPGYSMTIENSDPTPLSNVALIHESDDGFKFTNYSGTPSYGWVNPSSGEAIMGFAIGTDLGTTDDDDIVQALKNNGADTCGTGSTANSISDMDSAKCWRGLNDDSAISLVDSDDETDADGATFKIRLQARSNAIDLLAGNYTTTITVTTALK